MKSSPSDNTQQTPLQIENNDQFREALKSLNAVEKRIVGALFVLNVESLTTDDRVDEAIEEVQDPNASEEKLEELFKRLKRIFINNSARCGADADWGEQASHFVTRAAYAVIPVDGKEPDFDSLWLVVQNCRIARSCALISVNDDSPNPEAETQFHILNEFLAEKKQPTKK